MTTILIHPILGDDARPVTVRVLRQDIAPGEPAALQCEVTARPGEGIHVAMPEGAALVLTEAQP